MTTLAPVLAIGIGESGDGDDLVVRGRHARRGRSGVIRRRGDDRDAAVDEPADGGVEDVVVGGAAGVVVLAPLRHAHVDRLDERPIGVVRVALSRDPVEPADVPGQQPDTRVVEDLDRPQADPRRNADDADAVVDGADRAGDVGPMTLAIAPRVRVARRAVPSADDVQVGLGSVDARVDDRDIGVDTLVDPVDAGDIGRRPADPADPRRQQLSGDLDELVGHDRRDIRVMSKGEALAGRQLGGIPLECRLEDMVRLDACRRQLPAACARRVGVAPQDDDESAGRVGLFWSLPADGAVLELRDGRRLGGTGEQERGQEDRDEQGPGGAMSHRHTLGASPSGRYERVVSVGAVLSG